MARAAKKKAEAADAVPMGDFTAEQSVETSPKAAAKPLAKSVGKSAKAPAARRTFVLAVTNLKGGVAKTTTACNVG